MSVEAEQLPALADRILYSEPTLWERVVGKFNPRALQRARMRVWEETKRFALRKAKTLAEVVSTMERELREDQQRLQVELRNMDDLKAAYHERYMEYVQAVAFLMALFDRSKSELNALQVVSNMADHVEKQRLDDFVDKVNALESRALALAGTLARLPADQLVIRQLQNAGLAALQETTTTAASRFASIKMTLLTIYGTMMVGNVQRLASTGALLDANLLGVRSALLREAVQVLANAPGGQSARPSRATQKRRVGHRVVDQERRTGADHQPSPVRAGAAGPRGREPRSRRLGDGLKSARRRPKHHRRGGNTWHWTSRLASQVAPRRSLC